MHGKAGCGQDASRGTEPHRLEDASGERDGRGMKALTECRSRFMMRSGLILGDKKDGLDGLELE